MVETDISSIANPTIRNTGIPKARNSSLVLNSESISFGKS
jgi:hypothetical protein